MPSWRSKQTSWISIQRLRHEAEAAGTLWSNPQQRVTTERQGIVIEPANPEFIYPPVYRPAGAYGPWPYPDYPPLDISPAEPEFGLPRSHPLEAPRRDIGQEAPTAGRE